MTGHNIKQELPKLWPGRDMSYLWPDVELFADRVSEKHSFFEDCPRDEHGRCESVGGSHPHSTALTVVKPVIPDDWSLVGSPRADFDFNPESLFDPDSDLSPEELQEQHAEPFLTAIRVTKASSVESDALDTYIDDCKAINDLLRGHSTESTPEITEAAQHLSALIDRNPIPKDIVVARGMRTATLTEGFVPGAVFTDKTFISTTILGNVANQFADAYGDRPYSTKFVVSVPAGTKAYPVQSEEGEVILQRGTSMRVDAVASSPDGKERHVYVTVVPGETKSHSQSGDNNRRRESTQSNQSAYRFLWREGDIVFRSYPVASRSYSWPKHYFFEDCPRDEHGWCKPGVGGHPSSTTNPHQPPSAPSPTAPSYPESPDAIQPQLPPVSYTLAGIANTFPEAREPSTWVKVKAVASVLHEAIYGAAVRATPMILRLLPEVIDNQKDMEKLGYHPGGLSGTVGPQIHDPIRDVTGLSTHLACSIASHVVAAGIVWAKKRLAGKSEVGEYEDTAQWLAHLFDLADAAIGLKTHHDPEEIKSRLMAMGQKMLGDDTISGGIESAPVAGPDYSQPGILPVPEVIQETNFSCGAAATMSVCELFGVGPVDEADYRAALGTTEQDGTNPQSIIKYFASLGLRIEAREGMTLDDLQEYTSRGSPVITPIQDWGSIQDEEADQSGHYVVVIGFEDGKIVLEDPLVGHTSVFPGDFENNWHDQADKPYRRYGIAVGPGVKYLTLWPKHSFFEDCERDEHGWCKPGVGSHQTAEEQNQSAPSQEPSQSPLIAKPTPDPYAYLANVHRHASKLLEKLPSEYKSAVDAHQEATKALAAFSKPQPGESAENLAKRASLRDDVAAKREQMESISREHFQATYKIKGGMKVKVKPAKGSVVEPSVQETFKQGASYIAAIMASWLHVPDATKLKISQTDSGRAYYSKIGETVFSHPGAGPAVAAHEYGHHIEGGDSRIRDQVVAFAKRRFGDEAPVSLNEKFPGIGYSAEEFGRSDDFGKLFTDNPSHAYYIGKPYKSGASEILSMGCEQLYRDPVRFAQVDPDFYNFTMGILQGSPTKDSTVAWPKHSFFEDCPRDEHGWCKPDEGSNHDQPEPLQAPAGSTPVTQPPYDHLANANSHATRLIATLPLEYAPAVQRYRNAINALNAFPKYEPGEAQSQLTTRMILKNDVSSRKKSMEDISRQHFEATHKVDSARPLKFERAQGGWPGIPTQNSFKQGAGYIASVMRPDRHSPFASEVKLGRTDDGRAYYDQKQGGTVYLGTGDSPVIAAHEFGHHLESSSQTIRDRVHEFSEKRFGRETPVKLNEKFPTAGYEDGEMGRTDDFGKLFPNNPTLAYYIGKSYKDGSTELLSVGCEQLYRDPVLFARLDPEFYNFVMGILQGENTKSGGDLWLKHSYFETCKRDEHGRCVAGGFRIENGAAKITTATSQDYHDAVVAHDRAAATAAEAYQRSGTEKWSPEKRAEWSKTIGAALTQARKNALAIIASHSEKALTDSHPPLGGSAGCHLDAQGMRPSVKLTNAARFVGLLLAKADRPDGLKLKVREVGPGEAASYADGVLSIPGNIGEVQAVGMIGRAIASTPHAKETMASLAAAKFKDEPLVDLSQKFPKAGFATGTMGRVDDLKKLFPGEPQRAFAAGIIHPDGSSNLLSTGMELLRQDPVAFAKADPDFFNATIACLQPHFQTGVGSLSQSPKKAEYSKLKNGQTIARTEPKDSRPPSEPARPPKSITVKHTDSLGKESESARQQTIEFFGNRSLLGGGSDEAILASAGNTADGGKVQVSSYRSYSNNAIVVGTSVDEKGYYANRTFEKENGKIVVSNDIFRVNYKRNWSPPPDWEQADPNINGTDLLTNQVRALRQLGVSRIDTSACRMDASDPNGAMNGYYTWPRLGYDGTIKQLKIDKMPPELQEQIKRNEVGSRHPRSIQALFSTKEGRDWWQKNGESIQLSFDLHDDSLSMRTLTAYLAERKGETKSYLIEQSLYWPDHVFFEDRRKHSYFQDCPRDEHGWCEAGGGSPKPVVEPTQNQPTDDQSLAQEPRYSKLLNGQTIQRTEPKDSRPPSDDATLPKNFSADISNPKTVGEFFGGIDMEPGGLHESLVVAACNGSDGVNLEIESHRNKDSGEVILCTSIHEEGYYAEREFFKQDGKTIVSNMTFRIKYTENDEPPPDWKQIDPTLNGTDLLMNQVRALRNLGVDEIQTMACRADGEDPNESMNGYYTWPRLGYDGEIKQHLVDQMPESLKNQVRKNDVGSSYKNSIQSLFSTKDGRDWWLRNGESIVLSFGLKDESLSMRTLAAYMGDRKKVKKLYRTENQIIWPDHVFFEDRRAKHSYFQDCPRDEHGRCKPSGFHQEPVIDTKPEAVEPGQPPVASERLETPDSQYSKFRNGQTIQRTEPQDLRPPEDSARLPKKATVKINQRPAAVGNFFGKKKLTPADKSLFAAAVNATDGAKVDVTVDGGGEGFSTEIQEDGYYAMRSFYKVGDKKVVSNEYFRIMLESNDSPPPDWKQTDSKLNGTDLFTNQVRALHGLGVDEIHTSAGRDDSDNPLQAMNGYYTWPRMGYDGDIPTGSWEKMPDALKKKVTENEVGSKYPKSIQALIASKEGRDWWKKNGDTIYLKFDLSKDSLSMKTLAAYLKERQSR